MGVSVVRQSGRLSLVLLGLIIVLGVLAGAQNTIQISNSTFDAGVLNNVLKVNGNTVSATAGSATVTVPNSTDTLVGKATTDTLTNKTLNAESTGNVVTVTDHWSWLAATCEYSVAYLPGWSAPMASTPGASCVEGSNVTYGQADFLDSGTFFLQRSVMLPAEWTGAIDLVLTWKTAATANNVVWQIQTACAAVGESLDPAWNTAQAIADAAQGTTNLLNTASQTGVTTTGCAAGETLFIKIFRDPSHASDSLAATASLLAVDFTYRRAM